MNTSTYIWNHKRRFNAYSNHLQTLFSTRLQKVSVWAGFTCPNRDGTLSTTGCIYCNNTAFVPSYCQNNLSISQQIAEGIAFHTKRYKHATKYLAYFQSYSNTYAPINELKKLYDEALSNSNIVGLVIGTRPDCIDDEKLDYFAELSKNKYVVIEYGLESCNNKTLQYIQRHHTVEQAVEAIIRTAQKGIKTGVHLLFGLPVETRLEMLKQVTFISSLPLYTIKFHQLQIFKDTPLGNEFLQYPQRFNLFSIEEYIDFIIDFVEQLNPRFYIERFTSEAPPCFLLSQAWDLRTDQLLQRIEKRMEQRNTWQGRLYKKN